MVNIRRSITLKSFGQLVASLPTYFWERGSRYINIGTHGIPIIQYSDTQTGFFVLLREVSFNCVEIVYRRTYDRSTESSKKLYTDTELGDAVQRFYDLVDTYIETGEALCLGIS